MITEVERLAGGSGSSTPDATKIDKSTLEANSVLVADTDDTPVARTMAASTFLARLASGGIVAATVSQAKTLLALVKGDVGLGNVDNTSDVNKPVSTAQAAADTAVASAASAALTAALTTRPAHFVVVKTADETAPQSSSTFQNDDHLLFAIGANEMWVGRLIIIYNSSSNADIKVRLDAPAGASGGVNWSRVATTGGSTTAPIYTRDTLGGSTSVGGAGVDHIITADFRVANGATPGTVQLAWAQVTPEASDTKVLTGSHIIAHRAS